MTPVQTAAVGTFCQAVNSGGLPLDRSLPPHRLLASLTAIEGIDEQTAHDLVLRLGEAVAYPAGPQGATSRSATPGRWSPWRALAHPPGAGLER